MLGRFHNFMEFQTKLNFYELFLCFVVKILCSHILEGTHSPTRRYDTIGIGFTNETKITVINNSL